MLMKLFPKPIDSNVEITRKAVVKHFVEFAREKSVIFDMWCAVKVNDFSSLRELLLLVEFISCLPERVVVYLNEQKVSSVSPAAELADEFVRMTQPSRLKPSSQSVKSFYCQQHQSKSIGFVSLVHVVNDDHDGSFALFVMKGLISLTEGN